MKSSGERRREAMIMLPDTQWAIASSWADKLRIIDILYTE